MRLKITVIGDGFVGKTSLLLRYTGDIIPGDYVPTIFDNHVCNITVDDADYKLLLTDTSGQEDYERIRKLAYFNVDCFVMCFCVNSQTSLGNIKLEWYPEVKKSNKNPVTILVGTKSDLRQKEPHDCIEENSIKKMKNHIKAYSYVECSSITREGIDEIFQEATRAILYKNKSTKCVLL